jgi:predicted DNA-binding transcriptional regulator YafY
LRRRYDTFNNEINESAYRKIENAFNNGKTVEIGYFDMASAETRKREIDVYHKTRKYVIGYCHLRKAIRKFRTSRIVTAKLTDKNNTIPDNFDKNRY